MIQKEKERKELFEFFLYMFHFLIIIFQKKNKQEERTICKLHQLFHLLHNSKSPFLLQQDLSRSYPKLLLMLIKDEDFKNKKENDNKEIKKIKKK